MGRPKLTIDAKLVEELASVGCTIDEIARVVGCCRDTLANRFSANLDKGKSEGKTRLRKAQWSAAMGGNVTMLIWLGKQYLGQADKVESLSEIRAADQDGFRKLSNQELASLGNIAGKLTEEGSGEGQAGG